MWPHWFKSHFPKSPKSPHFSCSSFKDIQTLTDESSDSPLSSPKKPSVFHRVRIATSVLRGGGGGRHHNASSSLPIHLSKPSIILYFTTLRVVRKTFQDCKTVRSILRGFRVPIDERDLSMDVGFVDELQSILPYKKLSLPIVFIGGRFIGGAEGVRQLYESGELKKLIGQLPKEDAGVCDLCGGLRFVLCDQCNGSHKVYWEKTGFKNCSACNINGLISCPYCSPVLRRTISV